MRGFGNFGTQTTTTYFAVVASHLEQSGVLPLVRFLGSPYTLVRKEYSSSVNEDASPFPHISLPRSRFRLAMYGLLFNRETMIFLVR